MDPLNQALIDTATPLLVNLFLGVLTTIIAFVGVEARKLVKSNANNANADFLGKVAEIAVQAAEQVFEAGNGEEKKEYALDFAQAWLDARGVKVDVEQIETSIEAAVLREFNYPETVTPATPPTETVVEMAPGDVQPEA